MKNLIKILSESIGNKAYKWSFIGIDKEEVLIELSIKELRVQELAFQIDKKMYFLSCYTDEYFSQKKLLEFSAIKYPNSKYIELPEQFGCKKIVNQKLLEYQCFIHVNGFLEKLRLKYLNRKKIVSLVYLKFEGGKSIIMSSFRIRNKKPSFYRDYWESCLHIYDGFELNELIDIEELILVK